MKGCSPPWAGGIESVRVGCARVPIVRHARARSTGGLAVVAPRVTCHAVRRAPMLPPSSSASGQRRDRGITRALGRVGARRGGVGRLVSADAAGTTPQGVCLVTRRVRGVHADGIC